MIIKIKDKKPDIHKTCFIVENATIIGEVELKEKSNVWFNAVLRGDINNIIVGKYSNIQDGSVLHVSYEDNIEIGDYVTIGHNVTLHGCKIHNNVLIGMGAVILDKAEIGTNTWIAGGTIIPPGKKIPENSLVMGNPYKIIRQVTKEEIKKAKDTSIRYAEKYPKLYTNN